MTVDPTMVVLCEPSENRFHKKQSGARAKNQTSTRQNQNREMPPERKILTLRGI
jgi:hypothetical protein